jgi:hypothetical protein
MPPWKLRSITHLAASQSLSQPTDIAEKNTSGATWTLPRLRQELLALLLRMVGRCPWCLTEFTETS